MTTIQYEAYLKGVLRLSARGTWYHNDSPFTNRQVRDLFFRSIVWRADIQEYVIRIGKGEARFDCEDTAYFVVDIDTTSSPWIIQLTDGTREPLNPQSLAVGSQAQLYCTLQSGHRARFQKNCHQQLAPFCEGPDSLRIDSQLISIKTV